MNQNILTLTSKEQLIHRLKLNPTDSPYFLGQSSQADIGQECSEFDEFEGALIHKCGQWIYVSFNESDCISHNLESTHNVKSSHISVRVINNSGFDSKKILNQIDSFSKISLKADPKLIFVHLDQDLKFQKLSHYSNLLSAGTDFPGILKCSSSMLNQWQSFEIKAGTVFFKQIYLDDSKLNEFFAAKSPISKFQAVSLALSLIGLAGVFQFFKGNPTAQEAPRELKQIAVIRLQKNHPRSNVQKNESKAATTAQPTQNIAAAPQNPGSAQRLSNLTSSLSRLSKLSANTVLKNSTLATARNVASVQNTAIGNGNFSGAIGTNSGTSNHYFKGGNGNGSSTGKSIAGLIGDGGGLVDLLDKETKASEGLDKEEIAKVIKKNLGQVLYCYERQLSANSQLFGKMTVQFQIDSSGKVEFQKVAESSLNDKQMEACVLGKISKFMFPQPKDGMKVLVNYPFLFKSVQ